MVSGFMGYADPRYALSLREFGEPRELPHCGGWILVRPIPDTSYKDAMGCYPLFACRDWTKLRDDLDNIGPDLISLTLVTDPFSQVTSAYLEQCFDIVKPFKTHYVADLSHPLESFIDKHNRNYARKSLRVMDVEFCLEPIRYLNDWVNLYENLIKRHNIRGISKFSFKCFQIQLQIPGTILVLGRHEGEVIGANLIIMRDDVAYGHLGAYSPIGYKINASYGIYWEALKYLQRHSIRFYNMGGGAGIKENIEDGLSRFKAGWSNCQRTVYLCGRVFDRQKYVSICEQYEIYKVDYFPAYRVREFSTTSKNEMP